MLRARVAGRLVADEGVRGIFVGRQPPLSGIRVVDAATFIAAPFTASILGEFGADVIKVEQPGTGDPLRDFGTHSSRGDTYCWLSEARNKKSITLDLRSPDGANLFRRLIADADILCENFRPGTLERWGLGPDDLQAINPKLIVLRISGYGQTGPYKDRPGFARIAHAFGGLAHLTGMPGGPPLTPGSTSLADYISGLYGVIGVMMALRERAASGLGQSIDLALYEPILRVLDELAPAYAACGTGRGRLGLGTSNACPHGHFRTKDGHWVAIACTNDKMFKRLAVIIGMRELASSDTYGKAIKRIAECDYINNLVGDWTGTLTRREVLDACIAGEVPCAPVNTIEDIFEDPHFAAREDLVTLVDEEIGEVVVPAVLPKLSATPGSVHSLGPKLGASNDEILGDLLGLGEEAIEALRQRGVI
jgi:crotonobetainyl-CoA:carnitine CoA-transferase CaiB-like acyl-CoA transferase